MRTAIFLGLTAVADATREDWMPKDKAIVAFISIAFVVMMFMDVAEFIKKMSK